MITTIFRRSADLFLGISGYRLSALHHAFPMIATALFIGSMVMYQAQDWGISVDNSLWSGGCAACLLLTVINAMCSSSAVIVLFDIIGGALVWIAVVLSGLYPPYEVVPDCYAAGPALLSGLYLFYRSNNLRARA